MAEQVDKRLSEEIKELLLEIGGICRSSNCVEEKCGLIYSMESEFIQAIKGIIDKEYISRPEYYKVCKLLKEMTSQVGGEKSYRRKLENQLAKYKEKQWNAIIYTEEKSC